MIKIISNSDIFILCNDTRLAIISFSMDVYNIRLSVHTKSAENEARHAAWFGPGVYN